MSARGSIARYAWGAMARRRTKAIALGGGLAFAVALVSAVIFLTDALRGEAARASAATPDLVVQRLVAGRPALLARDDAARLLDPPIPSLRALRPRVWGYVFLPDLQSNVTLIGVPSDAPAIDASSGAIDAGRDLAHGAHEMIAGGLLARYLGLHLHDELALPSAHASAPLRLVGTFASRIELYTADVILCDEADARAILGLGPDAATDFAIDVTNPAETRIIARTVLARLPGTRVVERELLGRVYTLAYGRRAGIVLAAAIPALLALLVLAWDRASGLGPEERKEIAILKAVGFSNADVLWAKLYESLLIGSLATALGLALGYAWVFPLGAPLLRETLAGFSVLYPEAPLTPMLDVTQLVGIALAVLGPFAALSVVVAWRAASIDPMDSMRGA